MKSLWSRAWSRLRYLAHWRCAEPVLLIESDDWGLRRHDAVECLLKYGQPREWADEEMETEGDLDALYSLLERFRDANGRTACLTADFIVANPDFGRIQSSNFTQYYDIPISEMRLLHRKWEEGLHRGVFFPQYHGRRHFSANAWLQDLRDGTPAALELFSSRCYGGLALLEGQGWRYHSEYVDWQDGCHPPEDSLNRLLADSLTLFETVFGFASRSTVAPHYIFTPRVERAWHNQDLAFVQSSNYRILPAPGGRHRIVSHVLGEMSPEGLIYLTRNVRFEPSRTRLERWASHAIPLMMSRFRDRLPVVLDTHRINYTGQRRQQSLDQLEMVLNAAMPLKPHFLTTVELGEAIANGGVYQDTFSGEKRTLTPLRRPHARALRRWFGAYHARLVNGTPTT